MIAGYVHGTVVACGLQILNGNKHLLEELVHACKAHFNSCLASESVLFTLSH